MGYGNFRDSGGSGGFGGRSGGRGGFGGRGGGGGGFRRPFGPREMTKIKCAECGKEDEVPFKPRDNSSVLCKACYFKKKGIEPRQPFAEGQGEAKPAAEVAEKSAEKADDFAEEADGSESEEEL